ncbi:hypothetical protein [Pasteurella multocida]|uniref:hypothetical protein n=1 Tax=Pasteurella multocida TaxID=747 RepID=UPI0022609063|nr:hypothetical protein [Pasteurella multocida]UZV67603.1 hypothetical protein OR614_02205 [Pasteurella multocida]
MRQKNKSTGEKLDAILDKLDGIADKVDKQNKEIADLQKQVQALQADLREMAKKKPQSSVDCRWYWRWHCCSRY